jgi:hypothetical protein
LRLAERSLFAILVAVAASAIASGCATPTNSGPASRDLGTSQPLDLASGCTSGAPCYTGPPGTAGVGACKSGMLSCGATPSCVGQVLPTTESCFNSADDDCDGQVNNGCPTSISLGIPATLVANGGSGGGVGSSICPPGSLVTAVQVQLSSATPAYVVSVQPTCAAPMLVAGANSYSVTLAPAASPAALVGSDAARSGISPITCAAGGFSTANGTLGTVVGGGAPFVESLGINCAVVAPVLDTNNRLQFTFTHDDGHSLAAAVQPTSGTPWTDGCPANEVLIGFDGRTGARMDQVQAVCAPLMVTYK